MSEFTAVVDATFLGSTLWQWSVGAAIALGVLFGLLLLRRVVRSHYQRLAATPQSELMELPLQVASRTTFIFMLIASMFAGLQSLHLQPSFATWALNIFTVAVFWQTGLWATTAVLASLERKRARTLLTDRATASSLGVIGFVAKLTIWAFVLLLTLDNLGIEIKPLLAGLGIGGIAVALAAQNILGDLFASLSITLDRPFVVGDSLSVDEFSGTVEYIGVKSTRLRSVNGEQIIMPNANLLASRVRNNTRLIERRVVINLSLAPETPRAQLEKVPRILRRLIESQQNTRFDRAHFAKISPTAFDFEAVYFVTVADYVRHMDILQQINLQLLDELEKEAISLAYPAQRLVLEQAGRRATGDGLRSE